MVAYELLVGDAPFTADNAFELMAKQIHERPVPLRAVRPDLPPALDELVLAMLAKDPRERPGLASCRRRLDAALDPDVTQRVPRAAIPTPRPDVAAVFTPPPGRFAGPTPRIGLVMAVGALVVVVAVLAGAWLLEGRAAVARPLVEEPAAEVPTAPARAEAPLEPAPPSEAEATRKEPPRKRRGRHAEAERGPVRLR